MRRSMGVGLPSIRHDYRRTHGFWSFECFTVMLEGLCADYMVYLGQRQRYLMGMSKEFTRMFLDQLLSG